MSKIPRGNQKPSIEGQATQWQRGKKTNNDLLNITQKTNDRATPLKPGVNSGVPER
jgi:hypothetical protein